MTSESDVYRQASIDVRFRQLNSVHRLRRRPSITPTCVYLLCFLSRVSVALYLYMFESVLNLHYIKTHHYIIFFVRPLHSNGELFLIKYRPFIIVGL